VSLLHVRSRTGGEVKLNCTSFTAPITADISTVQTRVMTQHFPIKVNQPEVEFNVIFRNEREYEQFQMFVRRTQTSSLVTNGVLTGVSLWWPERDIRNWTGVIKEIKAGGARRNFTPRARFVVSLIESSVAKRTDVFSLLSSWQTIVGYGSPDGVLGLPYIQNLFDQVWFGSTLAEASGQVLGSAAGLGNILNGNLGIP
jgi:hypothetical protein